MPEQQEYSPIRVIPLVKSPLQIHLWVQANPVYFEKSQSDLEEELILYLPSLEGTIVTHAL